MKLSIYVGSPKKDKSNTTVLMKEFVKGFLSVESNSCELFYIYDADNNMLMKSFINSRNAIMAFPLYFNAMPCRVKEFMECLVSSQRKYDTNLGFIIQFAFPEAFKARDLETYLNQFADQFCKKSLGVILTGRCEGIDQKTCFFNRHIITGMYLIGKNFGRDFKFNFQLANKYLKTPNKFNCGIELINKITCLYINKVHWNKLIEKNCTLNKSFARPYV